MGSALLQCWKKGKGKTDENRENISRVGGGGGEVGRGEGERSKANVVEWMRMWQRRWQRLSNAAAMFCLAECRANKEVWQRQ